MRWVFWLSAGFVVFAYAGYPLWLFCRRAWRSLPVSRGAIFPAVSVVVALRNEARVIGKKLENLERLHYPPDHLEVVFVSDGSTDETSQILQSRQGARVKVVLCEEHRGKAFALNRAIEVCRGEVIVFTDARQELEPDAIERLVENFADPSVGCVSGELMIRDPARKSSGEGLGLYWNLEKRIRLWEGQTGSVVGATGALYGVRRELLVPLPEGTILDDVFLPMQVARQGRRVIFEPRAIAWDLPSSSAGQEFRRKVRTLTGNYQLLQLAPWLLTRQNPLRFEYCSHKLMRLFAPFALAGVLLGSLLLGGRFYGAIAALQLAFYGLAPLGFFERNLRLVGRVANVALAFLLLNTAAVVALVNFMTGKREVWVR